MRLGTVGLLFMRIKLQFIDFPDLHDSEIKLVHKSYDEPDLDKGYSPRYGFSIVIIETNEDIGVIYFAVDNSRRQYMRGHISYGVSPAHSGHNYAMKACKLVKNVALAHGFDRVFIGSGYDNVASRRTIEKLGAVPVTIDDVPDDDVLRYLQEERIDMYVWDIGK